MTLSQQLGLRFLDLLRTNIQPEATRLVPADFCREHILIPIDAPTGTTPRPDVPMRATSTIAPCPGADLLPEGSIIPGCAPAPSGSVQSSGRSSAMPGGR